MLYNAVAPIDNGEETPASRMSDVVNLSDNLHNWFMEADFGVCPARQKVTWVLQIDIIS